jgi:DUF438 domain-containing protein
MDKNSWYKAFPGAITVTDKDGTVINMNDASAELFKDDGGFAVLGRNAITCHPERTQEKVRKLYENHSYNIYSITKNGEKRLVYQAPYFIDGEFAGLVELYLKLPEDIPHFDRDKGK